MVEVKKTIPSHIAIIPDGNRRWARNKNLQIYKGHEFSSEHVIPALIKASERIGIKYITFWTLSTENFSRPKLEVEKLFSLIRLFTKTKLQEFKQNGIRIKIIGNIYTFPNDIVESLQQAMEETKENTRITAIFALNYGGRDEMTRAIQRISNPKDVSKDSFSSLLDTADIPDPEIIIRTGGEKRLSGFMLWQSEYSELFFLDEYFPDITEKHIETIVDEYHCRQRRFGK